MEDENKIKIICPVSGCDRYLTDLYQDNRDLYKILSRKI